MWCTNVHSVNIESKSSGRLIREGRRSRGRGCDWGRGRTGGAHAELTHLRVLRQQMKKKKDNDAGVTPRTTRGCQGSQGCQWWFRVCHSSNSNSGSCCCAVIDASRRMRQMRFNNFSLFIALRTFPIAWRALKYSWNDVNVACCPAIYYATVPHEDQRHLSISVGHFSFRFQVHLSKFMSDPRH